MSGGLAMSPAARNSRRDLAVVLLYGVGTQEATTVSTLSLARKGLKSTQIFIILFDGCGADKQGYIINKMSSSSFVPLTVTIRIWTVVRDLTICQCK